jgi:hypothetical protein
VLAYQCVGLWAFEQKQVDFWRVRWGALWCVVVLDNPAMNERDDDLGVAGARAGTRGCREIGPRLSPRADPQGRSHLSTLFAGPIASAQAVLRILQSPESNFYVALMGGRRKLSACSNACPFGRRRTQSVCADQRSPGQKSPSQMLCARQVMTRWMFDCMQAHTAHIAVRCTPDQLTRGVSALGE